MARSPVRTGIGHVDAAYRFESGSPRSNERGYAQSSAVP